MATAKLPALCQGLFSFSFCPHSWEWARSWERHSWDSGPHLAKGISQTYCVMLSSKGSGKTRKGITVVTSNHYVCWGHAFQEVAKCLPANGKQWINSLFCFVFTHSFCFSYKTDFSLIHKFVDCRWPSSSGQEKSELNWKGLHESDSVDNKSFPLFRKILWACI